jgi:hypothetical protein
VNGDGAAANALGLGIISGSLIGVARLQRTSPVQSVPAKICKNDPSEGKIPIFFRF